MWKTFYNHQKNSWNFWRAVSQLNYKQKQKLDQYYSLLGVSKDCNDAELRESYIDQAKELHPDSGSRQADVVKFTQLDHAYRTILQYRQEERTQTPEANINNLEENEEELFDIKHTVPQHRQYLSNEGIGYGTPGERKRQYDMFKVHRANENVHEYKINQISSQYETSIATRERKLAKKIKKQNAIERLVEDLILESMSKGEFDNLRGMGKPLETDSYHPMGDTSMYHLNKILIEEGYKPEWTILQQEIRQEITTCREQLLHSRLRIGAEPVTSANKRLWENHVEAFRIKIKDLNEQVDNLNLKVPIMWQQMAHYNIDKEITKVLAIYQEKVEKGEANIDVEEPAEKTAYDKLDFSESSVFPGMKDVFKELKLLFMSRKSSK